MANNNDLVKLTIVMNIKATMSEQEKQEFLKDLAKIAGVSVEEIQNPTFTEEEEQPDRTVSIPEPSGGFDI